MSPHLQQPDRIIAQCKALLAEGQIGNAVVRLAKASQQHPANPDILTLNGLALLAFGQPAAAIGVLLLAAKAQPNDAAAHARLVEPLFRVGDLQMALTHGIAAFRLLPDSLNAGVLSTVLCQLCRYDEALAFADHALSLQPGDVTTLVKRALALDGLGRFEEARNAGQQAIANSPSNAMAQYHQGERLLGHGHLTPEAWALYGSRLTLNGCASTSGLKVWNGEDITSRTILLHAEQGLGDTLQFVRYAPLVAARAGRVVLAVQATLVQLLQGTPGVDEVVQVGSTLPKFDVACPLLSLPGIFGTTLESIPAALPYAQRFVPWSDPAAGLRVGLVWAGNADFVNDKHRSIAPASLAALAGVAGVQFYSLQQHKGVPVSLPEELGAIDLMLGVEDFTETAALVAGLDLVISADTAVAHLAATMGKPVWLLSRFRGCWRWLNHRDDSPWYPTLRIMRQQQPNDWGDPLRRIRQDLTELAAQGTARAPGEARRAEPKPRPCKACHALSPAIGIVDFNKCCEDLHRASLPRSGRRVTYHRCPQCALVFTGDFDAWSVDEFRRGIYNEGYAEVDPDYAVARPAASASIIASLFGRACRGMAVLDYGGGDGALAVLLSRDHGMIATTYDPFNPACDVLPARRFPLVACFEVLEHTSDPRATIAALAGLVQDDGAVLFSTLLQPADFASKGVNWWYVAPRNGHLTIFSPQALKALWAEIGFEMVSHGDNLHVAARVLPVFTKQFSGAIAAAA